MNAIILDEMERLISSNPAPVLLTDTCALFDIIRMPSNKNTPVNHLLSISSIRDKCKKKPNGIYIILTRQVIIEFDNKLEDIIADVKDILDMNEQISMRYYEISNTLSSGVPKPISYFSIVDSLVDLVMEIKEKALVLEDDTNTKVKASERAELIIPPGGKGKIHDCLIYEHFIELVRLLRENSFKKNISFITSNTKDYGKAGNPREKNKKEIDRLNIIYTNDWRWAHNELFWMVPENI